MAVMRRQMNPRQRQGLLLVVIAAAGLIGVFVLVANYVSSVSKQVGPKVDVLTLIRPLQAYQPVSTGDLGYVALPEKWVPGTALRDASQALGQISQVPLPTGTELEQGMLTGQPTLRPGSASSPFPLTRRPAWPTRSRPAALWTSWPRSPAAGKAGPARALLASSFRMSTCCWPANRPRAPPAQAS